MIGQAIHYNSLMRMDRWQAPSQVTLLEEQVEQPERERESEGWMDGWLAGWREGGTDGRTEMDGCSCCRCFTCQGRKA